MQVKYTNRRIHTTSRHYSRVFVERHVHDPHRICRHVYKSIRSIVLASVISPHLKQKYQM